MQPEIRKSLCTRLPSCHGFTLIELLVVVAVVGILAAIAIGNYRQSLTRADRALGKSNLRTIHTALLSYRTDYNRYPLADCLSDTVAHPDKTSWGCGPAANGYWCGISLLLAELDYCPAEALFDPGLKRAHQYPIEAYASCSDSSFGGKSVPEWQFFRFAYNNAAADVGGANGGEHNIEENPDADVWLVRSANVDSGEFDKERAFRFPYLIRFDSERPGMAWWGELELTLGGRIREREVQLVRR